MSIIPLLEVARMPLLDLRDRSNMISFMRMRNEDYLIYSNRLEGLDRRIGIIVLRRIRINEILLFERNNAEIQELLLQNRSLNLAQESAGLVEKANEIQSRVNFLRGVLGRAEGAVAVDAGEAVAVDAGAVLVGDILPLVLTFIV